MYIYFTEGIIQIKGRRMEKKEEIEEWHDVHKPNTTEIISHVFTTALAAKKISKIILKAVKEEDKIKISWNVIFTVRDYEVKGKMETTNERAWKIALIISRASKLLYDLNILDGFHNITGMDRLITILQKTRGGGKV